MSKSAVVQFLESVAQPPELGEFQIALNDSVVAIVELGKKKGYAFDAKELCETIAQVMNNVPSPDALSESDLNAVVGGATYSNNLRQIGIALHNYDTLSEGDSFWLSY